MKITLKDCASKYEGRKVLEPADWPRAAALIRAAQEVIDVAETYYTRYAQDEAEDVLEDGETLADLRLLICRPIYPRQLDSEFFGDNLPEGEERLPPVVEQAIDAFNAAVAGVILSWEPGKVALNTGDRP